MSATQQSSPHACPLGGDYWVNRVAMDPNPASTGPSVWGIADTHAHMMAHLAFGGKVIWGFPDGPVQQALGSCGSLHGPFGLSRPGLMDGPHSNEGYPEFRGWPKFTTRNHQQMYVDWIRRAYDGGLRLIVSLAVDNRLLARMAGAPKGWDDRVSIVEQLRETRAFVERNNDFMEVADCPRRARSIVSQNRLAVVLGVEVDSIGIGKADTPFQREQWLQALYHELGVRHIFPVHLTDNIFGGAAIYDESFDFANIYSNGACFDLASPVDERIDFALGGGFRGCVLNLLRYSLGKQAPSPSLVAHANRKGLTLVGRTELLPTMIRLGMIVDVDHMSARSVAETLAIAERHCYPVIAGHAGFRDLALTRKGSSLPHRFANEYCRSGAEISRISKLGGVVSIGLNQGDVKTFDEGNVANDCAGSAKSFAQSYLYACQLTGGKSIALGSDMNGLAGCPGPRFGRNAARVLNGDSKRRHLRPEQRAAQSSAVNYGISDEPKFPVRNHPRLSQSVTGKRAFNLNHDGVAHYGMLPDFLQDLRNIGLTLEQLNPLFRSAEDYIRLWERCELSKPG